MIDYPCVWSPFVLTTALEGRERSKTITLFSKIRG